MIVSAENLTVSFHNKIILKNISFSIPKGKIVAIVGNSGAGKTVTGLTIMGLLKWYQGKIEQGKILYHRKDQKIDLTKMTEQELQKIRGKELSMIFQDPVASLNPIMRIGKQLEEVVSNVQPKKQKELIYDVFHRVGLIDVDRIYKAYPFALSGGMCQRVMIAMSLLSKPSLLIADEPTTFLDPDMEMQILDLLKKINIELNCTMLLITHNLKIAAAYADEIIVMHQGEIAESGLTEAVFRSPKHSYTKSLLNSVY